MRIIGLTGGLASGKSTVSAHLKEKNVTIIDCDVIARHIIDIGNAAYYKVTEAFGGEILDSERNIDRKKLGGIVFGDENKLKVLNSIVHPAVIERAKQLLAEAEEKGETVAVIDAPLLIEAGMNKLCTEVWLVAVPRELQIQRGMARDNATREQIEARLNKQLSFEEKARFADEIIDNSGTVEELYSKTDKILYRN